MCWLLLKMLISVISASISEFIWFKMDKCCFMWVKMDCIVWFLVISQVCWNFLISVACELNWSMSFCSWSMNCWFLSAFSIVYSIVFLEWSFLFVFWNALKIMETYVMQILSSGCFAKSSSMISSTFMICLMILVALTILRPFAPSSFTYLSTSYL